MAQLDQSAAQLQAGHPDGPGGVRQRRGTSSTTPRPSTTTACPATGSRPPRKSRRAGTTYNQGYEEAQQQFADAEEELADAESKIREIEEGQWYIYTRADNTSFSSYDSNADKIAAIATVFPLFFFLVAALVALTTMTRMVEEERQQVGTLKALGYSTGQNCLKVPVLCLPGQHRWAASSGLAVGTRLFPYIIINAYNIMYDVPDILYAHSTCPTRWLCLCAAMIACTLLVTAVGACWADAAGGRPPPLMLPKAPKAGKRILLERITPLWSRLKFTSKVTARNLFRYKKRFLMTVVGICRVHRPAGHRLWRAGLCSRTLWACNTESSANTSSLWAWWTTAPWRAGTCKRVLEDNSRMDRVPGLLCRQEMDIVPMEGKPADSLVVFVPQDVDGPGRSTSSSATAPDGQEVTFDEDAVVVTGENLPSARAGKWATPSPCRTMTATEAQLTITDICENYIYALCVHLPQDL